MALRDKLYYLEFQMLHCLELIRTTVNQIEKYGIKPINKEESQDYQDMRACNSSAEKKSKTIVKKRKKLTHLQEQDTVE